MAVVWFTDPFSAVRVLTKRWLLPWTRRVELLRQGELTRQTFPPQ